MTLRLRTTPRASIKLRGTTAIPARILAENGDKAVRSGNTWTIGPDYTTLVEDSSVSALERPLYFARFWNSGEEQYRIISLETLLTMVSGGLDPTLVSIGLLAPTTDQGIYFTALDTAAVYSLTASGRALAGLTGAADKLPYFNSGSTAVMADFTTFARAILDDANAGAVLTTLGISSFVQTILDDADAAAVRATLGLIIGTNVQAWDADLDAIAALSGTNTIYYRSAANTWTAVTVGAGLGFSAGTLAITDAELLALAGLTSAADKIPYFTGSGTAGLFDFGTTLRARLTDLAAITYAAGDILYYNGSNLVKLAKASDGNFLSLASGLPAWASVPGGGDMLSTNDGSDFSHKYTAYDNLSVHGADIASASTVNLETATGNVVDVTGTTTITAITLSEGHEREVRFTGALLLTHGSSLVLPNNGANINTTAGDYAVFRGYAAGVVRCERYTYATRGISTIASATTTDLGTTDFQCATISGTTTITGFGSTAPTGATRDVEFSGALTLTHNATSLILPNGVSRKTIAGDCCRVRHEGSGNWRVLNYTPAGGNPGTSVYLASNATGYGAGNYLQIFFDTAVFNDGTLWNLSTHRLEPPNGARRLSVSAQISLTGLTANGSCTLKFVRNFTVSGGIVLTGGTDVHGCNACPDPNGGGNPGGTFDFQHADGDYYGWFIFASTPSTYTIDSNVAHTWMTSRVLW